MNSITKKRIGKNKWIVTHGDYPEFSLYERLRDTFPMFNLHRDSGYGYVEYSDGEGSSTYYGRISSINDSELDEMNRQDVESRMSDLVERIAHLQDYGSLVYYEHRDDGFLVGSDGNLYKSCENARYHRVYGVENKVCYN